MDRKLPDVQKSLTSEQDNMLLLKPALEMSLMMRLHRFSLRLKGFVADSICTLSI